jgi:hypothetical protein
MQPVIKRFSLLRRRKGMGRAEFLEHYARVHGPLAAAQAGFRQFTWRYVQNHVDPGPAISAEPMFDGISVTWQKPRADYRQGFFQHPDYANVRPDEEYLFDLGATVSLLAHEHVVLQGDRLGSKAIFLVDGTRDPASDVNGGDAPDGIAAAICNRFDPTSASAFGVGEAALPYRELWEIWFTSDEDRLRACEAPARLAALGRGLQGGGDVVPLAVREIVFFSGSSS